MVKIDMATETTTLLERLRRLHVAVVSDVLDAHGERHQVMHGGVRPLRAGMRVTGYAATAHLVASDVPAEAEAYAGELKAIDGLGPGDVLVTDRCTGAAFWGELVANAASQRGAAGFVGETCARDVTALVDMGFSTFVLGADPRDSNGRLEVARTGEPVRCDGVLVHPGDGVLADDDGVVVVPRALLPAIVEAAEEKLDREREMRASLRDGMPIAEAFARYGIL